MSQFQQVVAENIRVQLKSSGIFLTQRQCFLLLLLLLLLWTKTIMTINGWKTDNNKETEVRTRYKKGTKIETIDHLHNYGPGTRFGTSPARIGCDVCVSHLSFRFSSTLECRSAISIVLLAVPIEAWLVLHSYLIVFNGQVSSGSAFFTCHSSGWLIELPRPQQHGRMHGKHILPEKNVRFHARA